MKEIRKGVEDDDVEPKRVEDGKKVGLWRNGKLGVRGGEYSLMTEVRGEVKAGQSANDGGEGEKL